MAYYDYHPLLVLPESIALIGAPGAGTRVTGTVIGNTLGLPVHDIRRKVEHKAGLSLHELIEEHGQAKRRELEQDILFQSLSDSPPGIIILEPDSLDSPPVLERLVSESTLLYIERSLPNLQERLHTELCTDPLRYPMLQGYENYKLRGLPEVLEARQAIYRRAKVVMLARGAVPITLGRILAEELMEISKPHSASSP